MAGNMFHVEHGANLCGRLGSSTDGLWALGVDNRWGKGNYAMGEQHQILGCKQLALHLDGHEIRNEVANWEAMVAKEHGLLIVFGASDDLVVFRGAWDDEAGVCGNGGNEYITPTGLVARPDCDCEFAAAWHETQKKAARTIEVLWCPEGPHGPSWRYKTDIPHYTFRILEDREVYCMGIVLAIADIQDDSPRRIG